MEQPSIQRVDGYEDRRFSPLVLRQHGAFLVNGEPYEVEITGREEAIIRGGDPGLFPAVIEEFRFYAPHITHYRSESGEEVAVFPPSPGIWVAMKDIQPSQFYVDMEKAAALRDLIQNEEDVVIQALRHGERYISLDGHTRLYLALEKGFQRVRAVEMEDAGYIWDFVEEAQRRGILSPKDLCPVTHAEYAEKWDKYCEDHFARQEPS